MKRHAGRRQIPAEISEPRRTVAGCSGKRCYADKATAARLAQRTRRDWETRVGEYHCPHCHKWHIGEADAERSNIRPAAEEIDA
jgi:hypothetical protein